MIMAREKISTAQRHEESFSDKQVNPNLPDRDGVTPLMHASSLGHAEVIKVMMDYHRSGSVTIDLSVRDDNGQTAFDHASDCNSNQQDGNLSKKNEIQELLLSSGYNDIGPVRCPTPIFEQGNDIELIDMSKPKLEHKSPQKNKHVKNEQNNKAKHNIGDDEDSSIKTWAADLQSQHEDAARVSTLVTPSGTSTSRPGSRAGTAKSIALKERPPSTLSLQGRPGRPASPRPKPGSATNLKPEHLSADDDDEDISLESLSDLLGTVRQYAKEIHEIYAPIQRDEEERIKKRNERNARKKSKEIQKMTAGPHGRHLAAPGQQEVRVEIHKLEDQLRTQVQGRSRGRSRPEAPSHSRSHDPTTQQSVASLTVENEQLSSTWPRGRLSPRSRERFWAENKLDKDKQKASTISVPSASSGYNRPQIPVDWNNGNSIQQERDILNKAFKRMQQPGNDPLVNAFTKSPKASQLKEQMKTSRQSIIQVAKQHKQVAQASKQQQQQQQQQHDQELARQNSVPVISIIPPPPEVGDHQWDKSGGALPSSPSQYGAPLGVAAKGNSPGESQSVNIPASHVVSGGAVGNADSEGSAPRQSKNGGMGVKSSKNASGLRRRKSQDQGLGQGKTNVLEKY